MGIVFEQLIRVTVLAVGLDNVDPGPFGSAMDIFEGLFAFIDVASVIVDVVSFLIDVASSIGGDENRRR